MITNSETKTNQIDINFNASITIAKCTDRDKTYYQVRMYNGDGNYVPLKEYNSLSLIKTKSGNLFKRLLHSLVDDLADSEQEKFNEIMKKLTETSKKI